MKLTEKTVKHEVETTEVVCEITKKEFEQLCAETAANVVIDIVLGDEPDADDVVASLALTRIFAQFANKLENKLFNPTNTNEDPDKKEEK